MSLALLTSICLPFRCELTLIPEPRCTMIRFVSSYFFPNFLAAFLATIFWLRACERLFLSIWGSPETRASGMNSSTETGSTIKAGTSVPRTIWCAISAPKLEGWSACTFPNLTSETIFSLTG